MYNRKYLERFSECQRKVPYESRKKAERVAAEINEKEGSICVHVYECPWGAHFHVGGFPREKKARTYT